MQLLCDSTLHFLFTFLICATYFVFLLYGFYFASLLCVSYFAFLLCIPFGIRRITVNFLFLIALLPLKVDYPI